MQAPANAQVDQATLEGYIRQAAGDSSSRAVAGSQTGGSQQVMIRGKTVTLVMGEGTNHDGEPFRTLAGIFDGRGGPALLSVESPISSWNQQEVDRFIASIR